MKKILPIIFILAVSVLNIALIRATDIPASDGKTAAALEKPEQPREKNESGWYLSPRIGVTLSDSGDAEKAGNEPDIIDYIEPTAIVANENGGQLEISRSELEDYRQNGWNIKQYASGLHDLKSQLNVYIRSLGGSWGVYVKNLNTQDCLIINDGQYQTASVIKLFVMADVYNELAYGSVKMDGNLSEQLRLMITESDNYASNRLVKIIGGGDYKAGFDAENANTRNAGCMNTVHNSLFINAGDYVSYGRNSVSPYDCGIILEKIYEGELVSEEYSGEMLSLLKAQKRRDKIPYPLPEGTVVANKTGETDYVESDVGIVYSPACDYVICVLSNKSSNGVSGIRKISRMVYDYFQSQVREENDGSGSV